MMKPVLTQHSRNPLLIFIIVGLILMLGIILAGENLNAILPTDKPVMASTPSTQITTQQTTSPAPTPTPALNTAVSPLDEVGSILNNPNNFRVVPKDIQPAQAIIEGKTIKFLMGF